MVQWIQWLYSVESILEVVGGLGETQIIFYCEKRGGENLY